MLDCDVNPMERNVVLVSNGVARLLHLEVPRVARACARRRSLSSILAPVIGDDDDVLYVLDLRVVALVPKHLHE